MLTIPGGQLSSPGDLDGGPIASGQTLSGSIDIASDLYAFQFSRPPPNSTLFPYTTLFRSLNTAICLYPPDGGPAEVCPPNAGDFLDHQLAQSGLYTIVRFDCFFLSRLCDFIILLLKIPGGPLSSLGDLDGGPIASGLTLCGRMDVYYY